MGIIWVNYHDHVVIGRIQDRSEVMTILAVEERKRRNVFACCGIAFGLNTSDVLHGSKVNLWIKNSMGIN